MTDRPYFMENKKWFAFDFDKRMYVLTNQAPDKAKESYKEYVQGLKNGKEK